MTKQKTCVIIIATLLNKGVSKVFLLRKGVIVNIKIEKLRKEKGITQESLATSLGVTQGAVSQWEKGLSKPAIDKLTQIAEILECSVDELLKEA